MNETKIRNGEDFHFGSEGNEGFVIWSVKLGKFGVFFNGSLIYSSESFKASKNKVKSLNKVGSIGRISATESEYTCDNETCRKYYSGAYNNGLCGSCSDDE
tara:strand:- start:232 stop:534 length:303 start_codon:yes stop_codon:yes gene_type:complete